MAEKGRIEAEYGTVPQAARRFGIGEKRLRRRGPGRVLPYLRVRKRLATSEVR